MRLAIGIGIIVMIGLIYVLKSPTLTRLTQTLGNTAPAQSKPSQTVRLRDGDTYTLHVQEVTRTIGNASFPMLAYNGSIPGPAIHVKQGSSITLVLKNESRYETLLHSHGLRLQNASEGTSLTQKPIKPGESYRYTLTFPDPGIYWYHPHVREDLQQDLGMYGAVVVEPTTSDYWESTSHEQVLFVDDLYIENGAIPKSDDHATHVMMGTYGNTMLVNGETSPRLTATTGSVWRYYIVNSANARPFRLTIDRARMKYVGSDGGASEHEEMIDHIILGPSERAVIDVVYDTPGTYTLANNTPEGTTSLATITVGEGAADQAALDRYNKLTDNTSVIKSIDPYREEFQRPPDKSIAFSLEMRGMGGVGGHMMMHGSSSDGIEWEDGMTMMNENTTPETMRWVITDTETKKENMEIDWRFKTGELVAIHMTNSNASVHPMQHPIHFHGNRFLITAINGEQNPNLVWKDTALVPAGSTMDILLEVSNPGEWLAHCHIAEHMEAGMMLHYVVSGPSTVQ